jgi:hypothetical protein
MKLKAIPIAILFATVLLMFAFPLPVNADCGARTEDVICRFYSDVEAAYAALKACDIDAIGYEITADLYADAITDPNLCTAPVGDMGYYEIDMNGNYTIADHRDFENPMWGVQGSQFRKAATLLLDRDFVVSTCCGGFANRIDQQIAYAQKAWRNQSYWYEDGTGWEFDPAQAAAILDADGFVQGTTANPHYDAVFPGSAEYLRTYPGRHSKAGADLDPMKYCIRTDDLRRMCAGDLHAANLQKHGIPLEIIRGPSSQLFPIVMDAINYHFYTGGWSCTRFAPVDVYGLVHGVNFLLSGSNYISGNDSNNQPNYPDVDAFLHAARFPVGYAESQAALKQAMGLIWGEYFINIPMYSAASYWTWKCDLKGVVNGEGYGMEQDYMFYNAYKVGGGPLVYGLITPPNELNIILSSWYYDFQVLERIYETGGIDVPPYDLSIDQVGYLKEWTVSSWVDPDDSVEKTKLTRTWRSECPGNPGVPLRSTTPVTGAAGEIINVTQHYANLMYNKQDLQAWSYDNCKDVKTTRMTGDYTLEIYWNTAGYWNTYYGSTYIAPFRTLTMGPISTTTTETITSDADGWFNTTEPAYWIISAEEGVTPLTVGTDLDIYLDTRVAGHGDHKCTIRMCNADPATAYAGGVRTITVTYLGKGDNLGYTIGNQPWDLSLEGHDLYYITDQVPGTGGSATLKRNPRCWRETPLLGEIDFLRKPNGGFKIDIFDVVVAASAYGAQGSGVPDPNWFPGADLAPACCLIDIFDIVTITGKYGLEFDVP